MDAYKAFVRKNAHWLSLFEAVAQGATWLLPDRSDEITLEAISSVLGLVSLLNDNILEDAKRQAAPAPASGAPRRPPPVPWPVWLGVLTQVENLSELSSIRLFGDDNKYGTLTVIEGLKALLRSMVLLHGRQGRMLIQGGDWVPPTGGNQAHTIYSRPALALHSLNQLRSKRHLALLPGGEPPRTGRPALPCWPSSLPRCLGLDGGPDAEERLVVVAEALHVMRPLVYVVTLAKFGKRSWYPWTTSLAMDIASIAIHRQLTGRISKVESEEMARRRALLVYYLLRSPCFEQFTAPPLQLVERGLAPVPVVGSVYSKVLELVTAIQKFYFYTSAS